MVQAVVDIIQESILGQIKQHSSFKSKKSALETLRKIGKTICFVDNEVVTEDLEVEFGDGVTILEKGMMEILEDMTIEERAMMVEAEGGSFIQKLEELEVLANKKKFFGELEEVRRVIWSARSGAPMPAPRKQSWMKPFPKD